MNINDCFGDLKKTFREKISQRNQDGPIEICRRCSSNGKGSKRPKKEINFAAEVNSPVRRNPKRSSKDLRGLEETPDFKHIKASTQQSKCASETSEYLDLTCAERLKIKKFTKVHQQIQKVLKAISQNPKKGAFSPKKGQENEDEAKLTIPYQMSRSSPQKSKEMTLSRELSPNNVDEVSEKSVSDSSSSSDVSSVTVSESSYGQG